VVRGGGGEGRGKEAGGGVGGGGGGGKQFHIFTPQVWKSSTIVVPDHATFLFTSPLAIVVYPKEVCW